MREIGIKEFLKLNNPLVIDIRSHNSYIEEHVPNSINIPYLELIIEYPKKINKNFTYYIICEEGQRGREVSNYLYQKGYRAKTVNYVLGKLKEYNYINDEVFAKFYIQKIW